jgi:uncharacterized SAM-binding protein YcdF (DUF218 family)
MFFYISKIMTFLLMPYTQMCLWFILAIALKKRSLKKGFLWLGIVYLFLFSNRFIINEVLLLWEVPPTPYEHLIDDYEVGIVLGGVTNTEKEPRDRVYFFKGADRVVHACQLYKLGKINKILVSGGSSKLINNIYKEADNLYDFLVMCDVNPDDIILENRARNTYENAIYSSELLKTGFPGKRHLVITSAFHLRRSLLCFKKQNVDADGFSTDFYSHERSFGLDQLLIPDPSAFKDWQMIIHELFGLISYKVTGYI